MVVVDFITLLEYIIHKFSGKNNNKIEFEILPSENHFVTHKVGLYSGDIDSVSVWEYSYAGSVIKITFLNGEKVNILSENVLENAYAIPDNDLILKGNGEYTFA